MLSNIKTILENIEEISKDESIKYSILNQNYVRFVSNDKYYCIRNESTLELFEDVAYQLWQELSAKTLENIYFGYFYDKFVDFTKDIFENSIELTDKSIEKFKNSFQNIPTSSFKLITKLYGFCLKGANVCIKLGEFNICDYDYYINNLKTEFQIHIGIEEFKIPEGQIDNCFIIHNNIIAINNIKAEYIFFERIEQFINTMLYCIPNCSTQNENITYRCSRADVKLISINNNSGNKYSSRKNKTLMNPLYDLSEKLFEFNNQRLLFENIDKKNLNKLEQRVQMSVNWFGQSLRNNNLIQRYTYLSIALETLLSSKKVGLMDQSITYRLREYAAFLCTDDKAERKKIYDKISELYTIRSEISHSGKSDSIKYKDYIELLGIVHRVITAVRSLIEKGLKTDADLTNYINTIKGIGSTYCLKEI